MPHLLSVLPKLRCYLHAKDCRDLVQEYMLVDPTTPDWKHEVGKSLLPTLHLHSGYSIRTFRLPEKNQLVSWPQQMILNQRILQARVRCYGTKHVSKTRK